MQTATTARHARPLPELNEVLRQGNDLLNDIINVTFQQSDIDGAEGFMSIDNCYLCVALRRMGFVVCSVAGDFVRLDSLDYEKAAIWDFVYEKDNAHPVHGAKIVGKTLTLTLRC